MSKTPQPSIRNVEGWGCGVLGDDRGLTFGVGQTKAPEGGRSSFYGTAECVCLGTHGARTQYQETITRRKSIIPAPHSFSRASFHCCRQPRRSSGAPEPEGSRILFEAIPLPSLVYQRQLQATVSKARVSRHSHTILPRPSLLLPGPGKVRPLRRPGLRRGRAPRAVRRNTGTKPAAHAGRR